MISDYAGHAANERTLLAWVRTTVRGGRFGLAVARVFNPTPTTCSEALLLGS